MSKEQFPDKELNAPKLPNMKLLIVKLMPYHTSNIGVHGNHATTLYWTVKFLTKLPKRKRLNKHLTCPST
jgi:hypothetical protein